MKIHAVERARIEAQEHNYKTQVYNVASIPHPKVLNLDDIFFRGHHYFELNNAQLGSWFKYPYYSLYRSCLPNTGRWHDLGWVGISPKGYPSDGTNAPLEAAKDQIIDLYNKVFLGPEDSRHTKYYVENYQTFALFSAPGKKEKYIMKSKRCLPKEKDSQCIGAITIIPGERINLVSLLAVSDHNKNANSSFRSWRGIGVAQYLFHMLIKRNLLAPQYGASAVFAFGLQCSAPTTIERAAYFYTHIGFLVVNSYEIGCEKINDSVVEAELKDHPGSWITPSEADMLYLELPANNMYRLNQAKREHHISKVFPKSYLVTPKILARFPCRMYNYEIEICLQGLPALEILGNKLSYRRLKVGDPDRVFIYDYNPYMLTHQYLNKIQYKGYYGDVRLDQRKDYEVIDYLDTNNIQFLLALCMRDVLWYEHNVVVVPIDIVKVAQDCFELFRKLRKMSPGEEGIEITANDRVSIEFLHEFADSNPDFFQKKFIIYPWNNGALHWLLTIGINCHKRKDPDYPTGYLLMDSMGSAKGQKPMPAESGFRFFLNYIHSIIEARKDGLEGMTYVVDQPFGPSFKRTTSDYFHQFMFKDESVMQQPDGFNCGIAVVANAMAFIQTNQSKTFAKGDPDIVEHDSMKAVVLGDEYSLKPTWDGYDSSQDFICQLRRDYLSVQDRVGSLSFDYYNWEATKTWKTTLKTQWQPGWQPEDLEELRNAKESVPKVSNVVPVYDLTKVDDDDDKKPLGILQSPLKKPDTRKPHVIDLENETDDDSSTPVNPVPKWGVVAGATVLQERRGKVKITTENSKEPKTPEPPPPISEDEKKMPADEKTVPKEPPPPIPEGDKKMPADSIKQQKPAQDAQQPSKATRKPTAEASLITAKNPAAGAIPVTAVEVTQSPKADTNRRSSRIAAKPVVETASTESEKDDERDINDLYSDTDSEPLEDYDEFGNKKATVVLMRERTLKKKGRGKPKTVTEKKTIEIKIPLKPPPGTPLYYEVPASQRIYDKCAARKNGMCRVPLRLLSVQNSGECCQCKCKAHKICLVTQPNRKGAVKKYCPACWDEQLLKELPKEASYTAVADHFGSDCQFPVPNSQAELRQQLDDYIDKKLKEWKWFTREEQQEFVKKQEREIKRIQKDKKMVAKEKLKEISAVRKYINMCRKQWADVETAWTNEFLLMQPAAVDGLEYSVKENCYYAFVSYQPADKHDMKQIRIPVTLEWILQCYDKNIAALVRQVGFDSIKREDCNYMNIMPPLKVEQESTKLVDRIGCDNKGNFYGFVKNEGQMVPMDSSGIPKTLLTQLKAKKRQDKDDPLSFVQVAAGVDIMIDSRKLKSVKFCHGYQRTVTYHEEDDDGKEEKHEKQIQVNERWKVRYDNGDVREMPENELLRRTNAQFLKYVKQNHTKKFVHIPVGAKRPEKLFRYPSLCHPNAPTVKFQQGDSDTCVVSSLASALYEKGLRIESDVLNRKATFIYKRGTPMKDLMTALQSVLPVGMVPAWIKDTFNHRLHLHASDVFVGQMQAKDGSSTHAVSIFNNWIFDSNEKRAIPLCDEGLDVCCSTDEDYSQFLFFERGILVKDNRKRKATVFKGSNGKKKKKTKR